MSMVFPTSSLIWFWRATIKRMSVPWIRSLSGNQVLGAGWVWMRLVVPFWFSMLNPFTSSTIFPSGLVV